MADETAKQTAKPAEPAPGDGLRSLKSTTLFRAINYELYIKPVSFKQIKQNVYNKLYNLIDIFFLFEF